MSMCHDSPDADKPWGWAPMSTAPKIPEITRDGLRAHVIDLWHADRQERHTRCFWSEDHQAWFSEVGGRTINIGTDASFSHWMSIRGPHETAAPLGLVEGCNLARRRLETLADHMMEGRCDGGMLGGRQLKRALVGIFSEIDIATRNTHIPDIQIRNAALGILRDLDARVNDDSAEGIREKVRVILNEVT